MFLRRDAYAWYQWLTCALAAFGAAGFRVQRRLSANHKGDDGHGTPEQVRER